jgi:hypothetical protein
MLVCDEKLRDRYRPPHDVIDRSRVITNFFEGEFVSVSAEADEEHISLSRFVRQARTHICSS